MSTIKTTKSPLQARIDHDLKEWLLKDARRCGLTIAAYIERLIEHRRDTAPEIAEISF